MSDDLPLIAAMRTIASRPLEGPLGEAWRALGREQCPFAHHGIGALAAGLPRMSGQARQHRPH